MRFNYSELSEFQNKINLVSGIPGKVFSKFYVELYVAIDTKMKELNIALDSIPEHIEFEKIKSKMIKERLETPMKKGETFAKKQARVIDEVWTSLETTDLFNEDNAKRIELGNKKHDIELPTIEEKDLPDNMTGSQRLAIYELIK